MGTATIQRMEVMEGIPKGNVKTLISLKEALETAGVVFVGAPDNNPGVYVISRRSGGEKKGDDDGK